MAKALSMLSTLSVPDFHRLQVHLNYIDLNRCEATTSKTLIFFLIPPPSRNVAISMYRQSPRFGSLNAPLQTMEVLVSAHLLSQKFEGKPNLDSLCLQFMSSVFEMTTT